VGERGEEAATRFPHGESRLPATLCVGLAIALHVWLPSSVTLLPDWIWVIGLSALAVPLLIGDFWRTADSNRWSMVLSIALVAFLVALDIAQFIGLAIVVLEGDGITGGQLLKAAVVVWATNIVVFAILFWEVDRGGPERRAGDAPLPPGFLFPQMQQSDLGGLNWRAGYVDYLYVSITNSTAFSPTDAMPLVFWSKATMAAQSLVAFGTFIFVASRAVNLLG
jgi:hypothetical protein